MTDLWASQPTNTSSIPGRSKNIYPHGWNRLWDPLYFLNNRQGGSFFAGKAPGVQS